MAKLKLKAVRAILDMTQEEFADKLGVSRSTMIRYESGESRMNASEVDKVLALSGMKYEDIEF